MKVYAFESAEWAEAAEHGLTKEKAMSAVERGLTITAELLPTLSKHLNIVVRPHFRGIIPEYGTGGYTSDTEFIEIVFDKTVPYGAQKTLTSLYQTVFHEGNHAARWNSTSYDDRFIASVVFEGLATVFERDHAGYQPLYGQYEDDATMQEWRVELKNADWNKRDALFFKNPTAAAGSVTKPGRGWLTKQLRSPAKQSLSLLACPATRF